MDYKNVKADKHIITFTYCISHISFRSFYIARNMQVVRQQYNAYYKRTSKKEFRRLHLLIHVKNIIDEWMIDENNPFLEKKIKRHRHLRYMNSVFKQENLRKGLNKI